MDSTKYYIDQIGKVIAKGQITNGGPVILLQPENEYDLTLLLLDRITKYNVHAQGC